MAIPMMHSVILAEIMDSGTCLFRIRRPFLLNRGSDNGSMNVNQIQVYVKLQLIGFRD